MQSWLQTKQKTKLRNRKRTSFHETNKTSVFFCYFSLFSSEHHSQFSHKFNSKNAINFLHFLKKLSFLFLSQKFNRDESVIHTTLIQIKTVPEMFFPFHMMLMPNTFGWAALPIRNGNSRWCDVKKTARNTLTPNCSLLLSLFCFPHLDFTVEAILSWFRSLSLARSLSMCRCFLTLFIDLFVFFSYELYRYSHRKSIFESTAKQCGEVFGSVKAFSPNKRENVMFMTYLNALRELCWEFVKLWDNYSGAHFPVGRCCIFESVRQTETNVWKMENVFVSL